MIRFVLTLIIVFLTTTVYGQQMPIDFSEPSEIFTGFRGATFSKAIDPNQAANSVGKFSNDGGEASEGFFLDLERQVNLGFQQTIALDVYTTDTGAHRILLKLEKGSQPDVEVETTLPANSQDRWKTLSFNYSNSTGSYDRITIFIDNGELISGTYLIDNIDDGSTASNPNEIDVVYEKLVWSDEFDSTAGSKDVINDENWHHQTQLPAGGNWYNGEVQHYTNRIENSYVKNGFLNVVAKREQFTDQNQTKDFTSARLNSKFAFTYGRVDVLAKLPLGEGTWPAIWTLGKDINEDGGFWDAEYGTVNWPASGEIDIMEHGLGETNEVSSALHSPCNGCSGSTKNYKSQFLNDVATNFHLYSMNWSPDQITFLVDNVPFYTYNPAVKDAGTWPFDKDHYLLLNVALGGYSGAVEPSFQQSPMVIDYVRVYQKATAGITDNDAIDFQVYPNPAKDLVTIKAQENIDSIELYTLLGSKIERTLGTDNSFSVEGLPAGIYFLKIYSGSAVTTKRLVVK
jgi:beta-glucanase (GH16 family)